MTREQPTGPFAQTIYVAKSGRGSYSTIEQGLAAAALIAATGNRIEVRIAAGDYPENNPLTQPDYTSITTARHEVTRMICLNSGPLDHGVIGGHDCEVVGLQVRDATRAGACGFLLPAGKTHSVHPDFRILLALFEVSP